MMTWSWQRRRHASNVIGTTAILMFLILIWTPASLGLKHSFVADQDARTFIGPIGSPYGFLRAGCFGLDVFDFHLSVGHKRRNRKKDSVTDMGETEKAILRNVEAGFLLRRFDSERDFNKFKEELSSNSSLCAYDSFRSREEDPIFENDDAEFGDIGDILTAATDGIFIPIRNVTSATTTTKYRNASIMYQFRSDEEGLYFLMYQICPKNRGSTISHEEIRSTFELDFHYKNYDSLGFESYLTAGEMPLPTVFFYFSISYATCLFVWVTNIRRIQAGWDGHFRRSGNQPIVYPIHHLMSVLLLLKTLSTFFESVRYHYIRVSGHAELWSVIYYTLTFIKGTFLFTVILLLGSGWSFVKPFLTDREKKVIFLVLLLQIIDNIALVVLSNETEGESVYDDWSAVLHIVDILCCCAVLVPIVWQVNALERTQEGDEHFNTDRPSSSETARTLSKLKLFRSFYSLVVSYIYFTRILVYLFATTLDYRHTWIRYAVTEIATLAFYCITGLNFRPMNDNPYLAVRNDDSGIVSYEGNEVEMGKVAK